MLTDAQNKKKREKTLNNMQLYKQGTQYTIVSFYYISS